jgi:hypothetical protein
VPIAIVLSVAFIIIMIMLSVVMHHVVSLTATMLSVMMPISNTYAVVRGLIFSNFLQTCFYA